MKSRFRRSGLAILTQALAAGTITLSGNVLTFTPGSPAREFARLRAEQP